MGFVNLKKWSAGVSSYFGNSWLLALFATFFSLNSFNFKITWIFSFVDKFCFVWTVLTKPYLAVMTGLEDSALNSFNQRLVYSVNPTKLWEGGYSPPLPFEFLLNINCDPVCSPLSVQFAYNFCDSISI